MDTSSLRGNLSVQTLRAPPAYPRGWVVVRASWFSRALGLAIGGTCLAVLITAAWLKPDVGGTGTHEQLGLAPCMFKQRTGIPCPTCGMTTSFTFFAHGNLLASLYVQPCGLILAILAAAIAWIGLYIAVTGRPVYRLIFFVPSRYYFLPLLVLFVLAWMWKIVLTLRGIDGWH